MAHGRWTRRAIAGWLAGVSLIAAGCTQDPEPGPDLLRSIGPVVFTHEDGVAMIVAGQNDSTVQDPLTGTLVTIGKCVGLRIKDQEMVAVWPSGTALLPGGELRLPGGAALKPGDEFKAQGELVAGRLPGSVPTWPQKCARPNRVPIIVSVDG
jgi:hypothetical protein